MLKLLRNATSPILGGLLALAIVDAARAAQTTQNFDTQPVDWVFSPTNPDTHVWDTMDDGFTMRTDYGYRDSNFAGGVNPGEAGGTFDRRKEVGPPRATYYAGVTSGLNGNTPFHATGRFGWDEIELFDSQNFPGCAPGAACSDFGEWMFGWFSGGNEYATSQDPADLPGYWGVESETFPGGSNTDNRYYPSAGLGFMYNTTNFFLIAFGPGGASNVGERIDIPFSPSKVPSIEGCSGDSSTNRNCDGATGGKDFNLEYDPDANGGLGAFTGVITDANNITYTTTLNLSQAVRDNLNVKELNRFGMHIRHQQGHNDSSTDKRATRVWFDDLNYTSDSTIPPGVPGDYNGNGQVDAADYVVWRDGGSLENEVETIGTVGPEDYDAWRARFGNTSGSGSALGTLAVPEPASALLLVIGPLGVRLRRRG